MGVGHSYQNYGKCRNGMSRVRLIHNIASDIEKNKKNSMDYKIHLSTFIYQV